MSTKTKAIKSFRYIRSIFYRKAMILSYHRVNKAAYDPFDMNVSPENFAEQLQVVKKYAVPIRLSELIQKLKDGKLTSKHVAFTFDDGYADNFYKAKPVLEKYDIPATVFVAAGKLNSEFWWDELERLILTSSVIPEEISIKYNSGTFFWALNDKKHKNPKWSLFFSLYKCMHGLNLDDVNTILDQLRDWVDGELISGKKYRVLSHDELLLLTNDNLVEAGSHTLSHLNMSTATTDQLNYELSESKKVLQDITGKPVTGFAFPLGIKTPEAVKLILQNGYEYACTSKIDYVYLKSDRYSLPRFWTQDWDGEKFEKWFRKWIN